MQTGDSTWQNTGHNIRTLCCKRQWKPKEWNVIFCMFDSAHGITHLFVHHRTTDKYIFKVKVFFSEKIMSSTTQTNVWGRKIQDLYNDRYLKIFNYNSAVLFLNLTWTFHMAPSYIHILPHLYICSMPHIVEELPKSKEHDCLDNIIMS